jgi:aspartyl-tRNA(Asn)/glutamyl-tRNA(Gln) amidotransferase subunit A
MGLVELSLGLERKKFSSREIVLACLDRIEALDPELNAYVAVGADAALDQADACDFARLAGHPQGSMHGLPVSIKDIIDVEGTPTTGHSRITITGAAGRDAFIVARLRAAGAILLGKTSLHEFATGGPSFDVPWPPARNPWNPAYHPGGSSSGSGVAVAAGMVPAAIGTDTAGSVRNPATACGLVGMKPTYGAFSRSGIFPLAPSLDQAGPITRTVIDNAMLFDACLGHDSGDPSSLSTITPVLQATKDDICGLRIAILEDFNRDADLEILSAFDEAASLLRDLGAHVETVASEPAEHFNDCGRFLIQAESYAVHQHWLSSRAEEYGWRARTKLLAGAFIDAATYQSAQKERRRLTIGLHRALSGFDAAICVSSFHLSVRIDDDDAIDRTYDRQARIVFNLTGDPSIAVPYGVSESGLPMGFQISAGPGQDAMVYRVAAAFERASGGITAEQSQLPWETTV